MTLRPSEFREKNPCDVFRAVRLPPGFRSEDLADLVPDGRRRLSASGAVEVWIDDSDPSYWVPLEAGDWLALWDNGNFGVFGADEFEFEYERAHPWRADEALKLLGNGYRIVLFQDGLGDVTAVAAPAGRDLDGAVLAWRRHGPPEITGREWTVEDARRDVFDGPHKYAGAGNGPHAVSKALHCLTEKAIFHRLPDGDGGFFTPPPAPDEE